MSSTPGNGETTYYPVDYFPLKSYLEFRSETGRIVSAGEWMHSRVADTEQRLTVAKANVAASQLEHDAAIEAARSSSAPNKEHSAGVVSASAKLKHAPVLVKKVEGELATLRLHATTVFRMMVVDMVANLEAACRNMLHEFFVEQVRPYLACTSVPLRAKKELFGGFTAALLTLAKEKAAMPGCEVEVLEKVFQPMAYESEEALKAAADRFFHDSGVMTVAPTFPRLSTVVKTFLGVDLATLLNQERESAHVQLGFRRQHAVGITARSLTLFCNLLYGLRCSVAHGHSEETLTEGVLKKFRADVRELRRHLKPGNCLYQPTPIPAPIAQSVGSTARGSTAGNDDDEDEESEDKDEESEDDDEESEDDGANFLLAISACSTPAEAQSATSAGATAVAEWMISLYDRIAPPADVGAQSKNTFVDSIGVLRRCAPRSEIALTYRDVVDIHRVSCHVARVIRDAINAKYQSAFAFQWWMQGWGDMVDDIGSQGEE